LSPQAANPPAATSAIGANQLSFLILLSAIVPPP
jgi:hypothetical protein